MISIIIYTLHTNGKRTIDNQGLQLLFCHIIKVTTNTTLKTRPFIRG